MGPFSSFQHNLSVQHGQNIGGLVLKDKSLKFIFTSSLCITEHEEADKIGDVARD
jgi:hypothetical protein